MVNVKDCAVPFPSGGYTTDLTEIKPDFSMGFTTGSLLALFDDKDGLVQIEFSVNIPWLIDKELEGE